MAHNHCFFKSTFRNRYLFQFLANACKNTSGLFNLLNLKATILTVLFKALYYKIILSEHLMNAENKKKLTKAEQAAMRRNQIIDTALKLFAEKGFGNTTIKDISEAAGTSLGLMYHYFASKNELLVAIFERHSFLETLRKMLTVNCNKPVREVLYSIACDFYDLLTSKKELVNIVFNEMRINPSFSITWAIVSGEGIKLISDFLNANIASGHLKPHNTEVAARSIMYAVIMHFIAQDVFPATGMTTRQYFKQSIDIFLDGIAKKP
jgi:AcrR family transcriptional regulator